MVFYSSNIYDRAHNHATEKLPTNEKRNQNISQLFQLIFDFQKNRVTDGRTDQWTDRWMDGQTHTLIEM